MTISIENSKVMIHPEFHIIKVIIHAKYNDQSITTIKELGKGNEDEYSIEYMLENKTLVILWR